MSEQDEYVLAEAMEGLSDDSWANQTYVYFLLAKEFGWTPEEVDRIPYKTLLGILFLLKEYYDRLEAEAQWQTGQMQI